MGIPLLETTAPPAAQTTDARSQVPMVCLVIVWCRQEPWRVGESAFFPASKERLFGRGGGPIEDYASWDKRRPGDPAPVPLGLVGCLHGESLSRCQAKLRASAADLEVTNVGGCPMFVNGQQATRATLVPGDVLMFGGEVAFLCVLRLPAFPALEYARIAHAFGGRDQAGIVGESPEVWRVRDEATRLGRGNDFVLIFGETGTGKTGVARLIHDASSRAAGPFAHRNAITFTVTLLASELFGKVANFPTPGPAVEGALPSAEGGTLFLDEIGRLAPEAQGHLLVTLESGVYFRLGDSKERTVDVRVLGATNLPRSALQPDFLHRFAAEITLSPLRQRREDIPLLARELLLRRLAKDATLQRFFTTGPEGELYPDISGRLMDFLVRHDLPGNTRELDALLAAAIAQSPKNRIEMFADGTAPTSIPPPTSTARSSAPVSEAPSTDRDEQDADREVTKEEIVATLASENENVTRAARKLGVQRNKLYRMMKEFGIRGSEE